MLKVWGLKTSSNVQALMWCIGELGLAYERIDAGFVYGKVDTPEYLSLNPNGTIPTVQDGDNPPLWETGAILRYLSSRYAPDTFWPADLLARSTVDKWAEWAKLNIALKFTAPVFWQVVRTAPAQQGVSAITRALQSLEYFLKIADIQLSKSEFLAEPDFTLADIQFGHCLYRYHDINIRRNEHANIRRYYETLSTRPAFREHVMISYEELRVTD